MSERNRPAPPVEPDAPAAKPATSGRVQFDHRGQAVWEWSVKTGMFDRNASTQRIRKLLDAPTGLEIVDYDAQQTPGSDGAPAGSAGKAPSSAKPAAMPDRAGGFNPYERAQVAKPERRPRESAGGDPYSRGPAKKPESVSFNPYERKPQK